jgi:hypothetical protein
MAPGPAGFDCTLEDFFEAGLGAAFFAVVVASSSASNRAFSALRASSAFRFSSFSSLDLLAFAPSVHLSASPRSYGGMCMPRLKTEGGT